MKILEPKHDRVVIVPFDEQSAMYGKILVADMGKERPEMGTVLSVGPGRHEFGHFVATTVKVGDVVLVPKIGTLRIDFQDQEYYITSDKEILAVIKEIDDTNEETN